MISRLLVENLPNKYWALAELFKNSCSTTNDINLETFVSNIYSEMFRTNSQTSVFSNLLRINWVNIEF